MKDATKFANDIAKKDNDKSLEAVKKSRQIQILRADRRREAGAGRRPW